MGKGRAGKKEGEKIHKILAVFVQLRILLMELMRVAQVIDAETDEPIVGSVPASPSVQDNDQSNESATAFRHLLEITDDLAALDNLDEVGLLY